MGGLLFLFLFGLWVWIVLKLTKEVGELIPVLWLKLPICSVLFVLLLILPALDEVVGGWQFKQLCKENASIRIHIDSDKAFGKTLYFISQPSVKIEGLWVPVKLRPKKYFDSVTGEVVLSYNKLRAKGGVVFKRFSQDGVPMFFKSNCRLNESFSDLVKSLNISVKDKPE